MTFEQVRKDFLVDRDNVAREIAFLKERLEHMHDDSYKVIIVESDGVEKTYYPNRIKGKVNQ